MARFIVLAAAVLAATQALADKPQADACAAGLDAESKAIYDAVAPGVTASTDLRDAVTSATKSLVMAGRVKRGSAKTSATAAGTCLEKLKS